ncbi:MAG: PAS domain S-box protein [Sedimentisphaerales bacterium]|nr:PAS domain S-box protein [Sedimentisphaerales bacterium]
MPRAGKSSELKKPVRKGQKQSVKIKLLRRQAQKKTADIPAAQIKTWFVDILRNMSDLIWEVDENGVFTWCTGAAEDIFGVTSGELTGKSLFDFMDAGEAQRAKNLFEDRAIRKKPVKDVEVCLEDRQGKRHWLYINGVPVIDNKGLLKGYSGIYRDITTLKKAEESLRESELKFRTLADEAFNGVAIHDGQRIIEINKAFGLMWGYDTAEAAGMKIDEFFAPECRADMKSKVQSDYDKPYVTTAVRKNGTRFRLEVTGKFITYKGQKVRIATVRDITEQSTVENALQESEERLKTAVDAAELGIWDWNLVSGQIVWAGHNARLFGYKKGEFDGRYETFEKRIHPDDIAGLNAAIKKAKKEKSEYFREYRVIWPDGTLRWIAGRGRFIYDATGRAVRMVGAAQDITMHKSIEESLRKERQEIRTIIDSLPIIVFYKDKKGRFVRVNKTLAESLNIPEEKFLGKTVFDLYSAKIAQGMTKDDNEVFNSGQPKLNIIEQYESARGPRWVQTDKFPIFDKDGVLVGLVGFAQDITERKQAEEALIKAENEKATILNTMSELVAYQDAEHRIIWANRAAGESAGSAAEELLGRYCYEVWQGRNKPCVNCPVEKAWKTGRLETEAIHSPDGRVWSIRANPVKNKTGDVVGVVEITSDITERKQAEHKLLEYQKQLKRLAAQLALTEERERRRIAGELHDHVGQSLALAKIKIDTLHASATSQPLPQALEDISGSLEKAIQETRSLTFDLSNPILYELGFEAAVAEWLNEHVKPKYGISIEFNADDNPKPLNDDMKVMIFRNVRELLINIIKYAKADKVKVSISRIDNSMQVLVEDNGVGFDPAEVKKTSGKKEKF